MIAQFRCVTLLHVAGGLDADTRNAYDMVAGVHSEFRARCDF